MPDFTIVDLTDATADPVLVERAYADVLRPSFNADELAGPEFVRPGDGLVLTLAVRADGAPLGAALTVPGTTGIGLLVYLAVAPAGRGLGVGGRLVDHLRERWRADGLSLVLAEVHDPRGHAETADEHPEARLRFYQRAGAELLDVPWVQPALAAGSARVPQMLLLVMHRSDGESSGVASAPLLQWAREYFIESEGREPRDAQATALLARIGAEDQVRVVPMSRWRQVAPLVEP